MNTFELVKASLFARKLNSILSVILTALGTMLAVLIILFAGHIDSKMGKTAENIDFVIGAKGSPLQLILSSIYHVDIPTGNISFDEAQRWMKHPQVKKAIPLALGDSYHGYRIVGTSLDYIALYNGQFESGEPWNKPFQAVAGSATGLELGDKFAGAHGLLEGGHTHDAHPYSIIGKLKPTGTVLDRLILTSVDSVLRLHGQEAHKHEHEHYHTHDHHDDEHDHHSHDEKNEAEITAILIQVRSPIATMNLPRQINRDTNFQAAVPAIEITRLTSMLGLGSKTLLVLSVILVVISGLSIFSGMAGTLENRSYDLAIMRALGFSQMRVFSLVIMEGMILVIIGLIMGLIIGHIAFGGLIQTMGPLQNSGAMAWKLHHHEFWLSLFILLSGFVASLVPAIRAAKLDIASILAKGV